MMQSLILFCPAEPLSLLLAVSIVPGGGGECCQLPSHREMEMVT